MAVDIVTAARLLSVSRRTIYNLMDGGALPFVKLGQKRLIRMADLRELISRSEVTTRPVAS